MKFRNKFNVEISLKHKIEHDRDVFFLFDTASSTEIAEHASALPSAYPSDLDSGLASEILQLKTFMQIEPDNSPPTMLKIVLKFVLESVFPNLYVALRMFLTLPVTNCEGERSSSHLGRIKKLTQNKPDSKKTVLD